MQILTYGYELPENTDTGDEIFPAMQRNIERLDNHAHNGENSAFLDTLSETLLAANWQAEDDGLYSQEVELPATDVATMDYDTVDIWFKLSSGEFVYPSVERVSASIYKVFTNNNALDYVAYYR